MQEVQARRFQGSSVEMDLQRGPHMPRTSARSACCEERECVWNALLHPFHALASASGVWFCSACGAYGTAAEGKKSSAKLLAGPCKRVANAGGETQFRRLERGLAPKPSMSTDATQAIPSVRLAQLVAMHDSIAELAPGVVARVTVNAAKRPATGTLLAAELKRQNKRQTPKVIAALCEVMRAKPGNRKSEAVGETTADPPKRSRLRVKTRVAQSPAQVSDKGHGSSPCSL